MLSVFTRPLAAVFSADPAVLDATTAAMRALRWAVLGVGVFQVLLNSFEARGVVIRASLLMIASDAPLQPW